MAVGEDIIRVLRIIEYVGPRSWIEKQLSRSITGTRIFYPGTQIHVVTIGEFPEILGKVVMEARDEAIEDALGFNNVRKAS